MRYFGSIQKTLRRCVFMVGAYVLMGCTSLLPNAKQETKTPWHSYAEAEALFAKIIPGTTNLAQLKALGVDPQQTANVALLGHADLLRRLAATSAFDISLIDPGLHACMTAHQDCFAYEIEQTYLERKRFGNFWLDFLNFERKTDISGWQFDAIIVIRGDLVTYKLWSGKPSIHQYEDEHSPLGPLQGFGSSGLHR